MQQGLAERYRRQRVAHLVSQWEKKSWNEGSNG
jgi:hypothetical protein